MKEVCNPTNAHSNDWYGLPHAQYIFPVVESFAGVGGGWEEMVFDDGTRQSVSHLVSRMSSAHQRFYSPCFINATEQLASGQPENASDAAVKGNRISHGNQSPAPLVAMTKPLTFAKPQHSTLFWDIDM